MCYSLEILVGQLQNRLGQILSRALRSGMLALAAYGIVAANGAGAVEPPQRSSSVETNAQGLITRILWQPNREHGAFEVKQTDKDGNVTQWYQYFVDEDGKVLVDIVRSPSGRGVTSDYQSIRFITYNTYRADGDISQFYEFTGDGVLRQRVEYRYDDKGNWLDGIIYNSKGEKVGKELTPPEARLYGVKKH